LLPCKRDEDKKEEMCERYGNPLARITLSPCKQALTHNSGITPKNKERKND